MVDILFQPHCVNLALNSELIYLLSFNKSGLFSLTNFIQQIRMNVKIQTSMSGLQQLCSL